MGLNPGSLDRELTIQTPMTRRGSAGGMSAAQSAEVIVWAKRVEQGGAEFRAAGALMAETTTLFTIRYTPDISEKSQLICEGKHYDIVSINEIGRREGLQIQAKGKKRA